MKGRTKERKKREKRKAKKEREIKLSKFYEVNCIRKEKKG